MEKKNQRELPLDTPLNPRYSVGLDVDLGNPVSSSEFYTGDSINEHRIVETANGVIGEKEIEQQRDNL